MHFSKNVPVLLNSVYRVLGCSHSITISTDQVAFARVGALHAWRRMAATARGEGFMTFKTAEARLRNALVTVANRRQAGRNSVALCRCVQKGTSRRKRLTPFVKVSAKYFR
jgi:hypothetical protein